MTSQSLPKNSREVPDYRSAPDVSVCTFLGRMLEKQWLNTPSEVKIKAKRIYLCVCWLVKGKTDGNNFTTFSSLVHSCCS